ncbi:putative MFS family arabinose efflux permease [Isoptericola sp. CG 20/1183]|uniref:MFS family arabinose efflux permease n=1 Tax=Isoptericola halotolerans TaxID=300560 RepID=A0ABX5EDQ5_9MICO|nr:putative MFS family arabinose efflux permease [Isoptericola halotolerans]PRZ06829.1 putative MFS family arabinose efflux permease [Isoptericola sp. CG 20/1183]
MLEAIVPARMGVPFRWMLASSWTSNIGDGIALAAGPLLVASQTDSATLVALAAMLQRLPWLLFGLWAGALADRVDRRRIVIVANALRAVVVAVLCAAIVTGAANVVVVLAAMLLMGVAEVFADTTSQTLLPMLVDKRDLGTGNARLQAGFLTGNQLAGPPVGAFLFALGMAWPFLVQVVCVLLAILLISRISLPPVPRPATPAPARREIRDGLRWLWTHPPVRTLALVIFSFNATWAAPWGVLVLYSLDRLQMGPVGYGLLITATGVGGVLGTLVYGRLERRFSLATLMKTVLSMEVAFHLVLALTTSAWVAMATVFVFGVYTFVWGTVSNTVRQRAVPTEYQGRVGSVYLIGLFGGIVVGNALGGVLTDLWGITAPFWFAFVGAGLTLALVWRQLDHIAHAEAD